MNMEHKNIKHQVMFREPQMFYMPGGQMDVRRA